MPRYFVLYCEFPRNEAGDTMDIDDGVEIDGVLSWRIGRRFSTEVPNPIVIDGYPGGDYNGPPIELSDGNLLLMSDRLVDALREAGVDNMDCYPAVIRNTATGQRYPYQAVNLIGVISAADLGKSRAHVSDGDPLFDVSFESLAVDETAPGDALLFRLAENNGTILIHERVRDHLVNRGIRTLSFIEPEDWVRL